MAHIHYRFSSKLSYDTAVFDSPNITLSNLKRQIMDRVKLRAGDCDLQITNAQTNQEYTDDDCMIPTGSSIIVRRIPISGGKSSSSSKTHNTERSDGQLHHSFGASRAMDAQSSTKALSFFSKMQMANLVDADMSEEDKVKFMITQSSYESATCNTNLYTGLPPNYACYQCGNAGHHIRNCPTSRQHKSSETPLRIKKSTGIPRSFLVEVDDPNMKGAMLTNTGHYVISALDAEAYATGKKEKPPFIPQEQPKSEGEDVPIPDELLCLICRDLLDDAVVIPCCGNSYCDECIRSILLDSEDHVCPTCGQSDVSPDTLIANRFLRQTVNNFKKERGYTKSLRRRSGTSQSQNTSVTPNPVKPLLTTQSQLQKPHQSPDSQQNSLLDHLEAVNTPPLSQVSGFPPAVTGPASAHNTLSTSLQPEQSHLDEAYATGKKEKPPFIPQEQPKSEGEDVPIPDELLCLICHDLPDDAVVIPCCGNSYCDDCIRSILLDSEDHVCPTCGQSDVSPDTLTANRFLRQTVNNFKKERGYTKSLRRRSGTSQAQNTSVTPNPVKPLLTTQSQLQKPHQSPDSQQDALLDHLEAVNTPPLSQVSGLPAAVAGPASAHNTLSTSLQPEQSHLDETEGKTHDDSAAAVPSVLVSNKDPTAEPPQLIPLVDSTVMAEQPQTGRPSSSDPASSKCRDSSSSASGCPTVAWNESNTQQLSSSSLSSSSSYPAAPPPLFTSPFFPTLPPAHQSYSSYPPGYQPTTPVWTLPSPQGSQIPSLSSSPSIPPLIPMEWYRSQRKKSERSPHRGSSSRRSSSHSKSKTSKSSRSSSRSGSRSRSRSQSRSRPRSPDSRHRSRPSRPSCSYSYGYKRSRSPTPSSSSSPRVAYHSRSKSPSAHSKNHHHSRHHSHHHSRHHSRHHSHHHSKKSASSSYSSRRRGEHSGREAGGSGGSSARNKYAQHTNQTSHLELYRQHCLQWKEYKEWCEKYFSSNIGQFHQMPVPLLSLPPPPLPQCGDREGSRNHSPANFDSHHQPQSRRTTELDGRSSSSESSSDSSSSSSQSSSDSCSTPSQSASDSHSSLSLKANHSCSPLSQSSGNCRSTACVDGAQVKAYPETCTEEDSRLPITLTRNSEEVNLQEQSTDNKQLTLKSLEDFSSLQDVDLWHCALSGVEASATGKEEEAESVRDDRREQEVAELALTSQKERAEPESTSKEDRGKPWREEPMEGVKTRMEEEDDVTVRSSSQSSQNKSHHGMPTPNPTVDDSSSTSMVGSCGGEDSQERRTVVNILEDHTQDRPADRRDELVLLQVPLSKWEKGDKEEQDEGENRVHTDSPPVALPHPSVTLINSETEADNEQQRQRSMDREQDRDRVMARGRDREKARNATLSPLHRSVAPSSGKDRTDGTLCTDRDGETRKERGRERQKESETAKERTREEDRGRDRETKLERSNMSSEQKRNRPSHSHSYSFSTSQATERRDRQRGGDGGSNRSSTCAGGKSSSVRSRSTDLPDYSANKTYVGVSLHSKCEEKDHPHNYRHHRPAETHQFPPSLSHSRSKERDQVESRVEKGERKRCREEDEADKLDKDAKWKKARGGREAQQQLISKSGEQQRRQEKREEEEPKKAQKEDEAGRHRAAGERRAEETQKQGGDGRKWRRGEEQEKGGGQPH